MNTNVTYQMALERAYAILFGEKEAYEHLVNNLIPYRISNLEFESNDILKNYNKLVDKVGALEALREKIKSEKL